MIEKILIILLSIAFLGTFITRNLIVKFKTKQKIRSSDPLVARSIVFISLCLFTAILSTYSNSFYKYLGVIPFLRNPAATISGLLLFSVSIVLGWFISAQLKDSWRVGIHKDQKTRLIQTGIYRYVRNPYFLSYFMMFFSMFLIRPSLVLAVLIIITISIFHRMVLKEETHLQMNHGLSYKKYKEKTGRYLPRLMKKRP